MIYVLGQAYLRIAAAVILAAWVFFYSLALVYGSDYSRSDWGRFRKGVREKVIEKNSVGMVIDFYSGYPIPQDACQLDHVVPVAVANRLGGHSWPYSLRSEFYNDTDNLVCTTGGTNASKGDRVPSKWKPKENPAKYIAMWNSICGKYGLNCEKEIGR